MDAAPLTTLLAWAWTAFVIEADNSFETACANTAPGSVPISFAMWANGLRCIGEAGTSVGDLRSASRAACNLGGLERWGWIEIGDPGPAKSGTGRTRRPGYGSSRGITRSTLVRPTRAGSFARREWPGILARVEQAWDRRFGRDAVDALRAALQGVGTAMPWSPPEIHSSDGFWTHVLDGESAPTRDDGNGSLVVLLGQALTQCTLDHEAGAPTSLALAANGLRVLGDGPVRVRDLPARSGVSQPAVAMLTGFLVRRALAATAPGRTVSLTASGTEALDAYECLAARAPRADLSSALHDVLVQATHVAAGLEPVPGSWRSAAPYAKQTARFLSDPAGALPWHPMVLHRGGGPTAARAAPSGTGVGPSRPTSGHSAGRLSASATPN